MFENVPELSVAGVRHLIDQGGPPKFIDARDPTAQSAAAPIPGPIHVPLEAHVAHKHRQRTRRKARPARQ